jgi:hypothetical protein
MTALIPAQPILRLLLETLVTGALFLVGQLLRMLAARVELKLLGARA